MRVLSGLHLFVVSFCTRAKIIDEEVASWEKNNNVSFYFIQYSSPRNQFWYFYDPYPQHLKLEDLYIVPS